MGLRLVRLIRNGLLINTSFPGPILKIISCPKYTVKTIAQVNHSNNNQEAWWKQPNLRSFLTSWPIPPMRWITRHNWRTTHFSLSQLRTTIRRLSGSKALISKLRPLSPSSAHTCILRKWNGNQVRLSKASEKSTAKPKQIQNLRNSWARISRAVSEQPMDKCWSLVLG